MTIRTCKVGGEHAGRPLVAFLADHLRLTRPAVERLIRAGNVRVAGTICVDPNTQLRAGQHVTVQQVSGDHAGGRTGDDAERGPRSSIIFADAHVVVVNKPPGLTTMRHEHEAAEFGKRGRRFLPATLQDVVPDLLRSGGPEPSVRAVHRLDKETSGLVVFALTLAAESSLARQFRAHTTERLYRALVRGRPREGRIESWLVDDRGDGRRGSGSREGGQRAVTHVRIVETLGDFSLIECKLETGRTHQVRIHLGEAGAPLCGEHVYDRPLNGKPLPDGSGATRIMLHAATLGFDHPASGERVRWEARLPRDMSELLERLRTSSR